MSNQGLLAWFKQHRLTVFVSLFCFALPLHASFIESTIGTAVVNDATATYHNPAALTLLKNPQIISLDSIAYFHANFNGTLTQAGTGVTLTGSSNSNTHYYLPSLYLGTPLNKRIALGLSLIANDFNRDVETNSILRYAQSSNSVQDYDLISALGFKINEFFAIGVGLELTRANFLLKPITGIPSLHIPDGQSRNETSATSWGGDAGILFTPNKSTLVGFNYRSAVTYRLSGTSTFEGNPSITSNNYHYKFWTPARSVFSINHFVSKTLGFIATVQYIQWSIFSNLHVHNIATAIAGQPRIIPEATVPYHFRNTWLMTLGTHYRITSKWIVRAAGSYSQSPANPHYQIAIGDSIILGASTSYEILKWLIIDASYAHAFIKDQNINITTGRNIINGVNTGYRDAVSIKLTFNL